MRACEIMVVDKTTEIRNGIQRVELLEISNKSIKAKSELKIEEVHNVVKLRTEDGSTRFSIICTEDILVVVSPSNCIIDKVNVINHSSKEIKICIASKYETIPAKKSLWSEVNRRGHEIKRF